MLYVLAKAVLGVTLRIYNRLSVFYVKPLSKKGPYILVANHASFLDPIYIGVAFPLRLYFMAKKESFQSKIFGYILRSLGAFPVDREKADIGATKTGIRILKEGKVLAIFPQGGRRGETDFSQFKQGAAFFALKTGVQIIPVYITGTDQVMPKGQGTIKPKKVKIKKHE